MKSEKELHQAFEAYLRKEGLSFITHRMDRKSGIQAGFPDYCVISCGRCCLIEMKMPRGTLSPIQEKVITKLQKGGTPTVIARSIEGAVNAVRTWLGVIAPAEQKNDSRAILGAQDEASVGIGDILSGRTILPVHVLAEKPLLTSRVDKAGDQARESTTGEQLGSRSRGWQNLWLANMGNPTFVFTGDWRPGGTCKIVRTATAQDLATLPRK